MMERRPEQPLCSGLDPSESIAGGGIRCAMPFVESEPMSYCSHCASPFGADNSASLQR
jgi:hypothetical protein